MLLNKPLTSLASSFRKLIDNETKLSLADMESLSGLLKLDYSKSVVKPFGFTIDSDKNNPWKQVQVNDKLEPGTTYILMWDSHTTGSDRWVTTRVYDYVSNDYLPGGKWGGIFQFGLGPHIWKFTTPTKQPQYSVLLAKNLDGDNSGDGTTTFENVRLFKVGGGVNLVLTATFERRCAA